ncbi:hypothetical protein I4U23_022596 [Adineta vaga]|nr:hypothetical protein I4U23_022596 [Adineta vaga]
MTNNSIKGMSDNYNLHSSPQLALIQSSISLIKKGIEYLHINESLSPIIIADFGSSHGMNSIYIMNIIINLIKEMKNIKQESFLIIHNDLPTNNWNSLFHLLNQQNQSYFSLANGCSFYNRCLPSNCLTVAFSSASLHWLSKKPCNISNHCISVYAKDKELELFENQGRIDYENFLENRSIELIKNGILILIINCLNEYGLTMVENIYELLYKCAQLCLFTNEELEEFTIPVYIRSFNQCVDQQLFEKYSFQLIHSSTTSVDFQFYEQLINNEINLEEFAQKQTGFIRVVIESILKQTLEFTKKRANNEISQLINQFWNYYYQEIIENPQNFQIKCCQAYVILKKI